MNFMLDRQSTDLLLPLAVIIIFCWWPVFWFLVIIQHIHLIKTWCGKQSQWHFLVPLSMLFNAALQYLYFALGSSFSKCYQTVAGGFDPAINNIDSNNGIRSIQSEWDRCLSHFVKKLKMIAISKQMISLSVFACCAPLCFSVVLCPLLDSAATYRLRYSIIYCS